MPEMTYLATNTSTIIDYFNFYLLGYIIVHTGTGIFVNVL